MPDVLAPAAFDLDHGRAVLARTPAALSALLLGLPDAWLDGTEGAGTWSPRQVVGHLVDAERELWIPRALVILADGADRAFAPFARDAHLTRYRGWPLDALLDAFGAERRRSLDALAAMRLTPEALARTARHPEFGAVTLRQLLSTWVVHDLAHLTQITRTMARQYGEAVGPWRQYLSVLRS